MAAKDVIERGSPLNVFTRILFLYFNLFIILPVMFHSAAFGQLRNTVVRTGQDLELKCEKSNPRSSSQILWKYGNSSINTQVILIGNKTVGVKNIICDTRANKSTSTCRLTSVTPDNAGVYKCENSKPPEMAHLVVIDKTEVTLVETFPQADENNVIKVTSSHTGTFRFKCSAKSDPSTPVSIMWRQIKEESEVPVYPDNKNTFVSDGELRFVIDQNSTNKWWDIREQYRCHADNSYSADFVTVTLDVADIRVGGASLAEQWWIFIIIALILLILIIILCCCIYMQRNQGDTYPVDEKERLNGNDPEREIEVSGFQDYKRSELRKGSVASIGSSNKLNSEDGGSMNAYGSVDPGNFTED